MSANVNAPRENKAVYTTTLVACGWAGAVMWGVVRGGQGVPYTKQHQLQVVGQGQ